MVSRGVLVVIQRVSIFQRADNSYNGGEYRRNCTMLILTRALDQGVTARNATPRQFFLSHARGYKLDREIAAGAAPESSPLRALRAQILVRPSFRRTLARRVEQLLEEAGPPPRVAGCRMAPWSTRILEAAGALQMLIDRLQAPAPVPARGVAGVRVLLIDGAGPLYYPGANDHLGLVVLEIVEQLEPLTNW